MGPILYWAPPRLDTIQLKGTNAMVKSSKLTSTKKRVKVKDMPAAEKELTVEEARQVRGGFVFHKIEFATDDPNIETVKTIGGSK